MPFVVCARPGSGSGEGLEWGRLSGPGLRAAAEELQRAIGSLQHHQRLVLGLIDERKAFAAVGVA